MSHEEHVRIGSEFKPFECEAVAYGNILYSTDYGYPESLISLNNRYGLETVVGDRRRLFTAAVRKASGRSALTLLLGSNELEEESDGWFTDIVDKLVEPDDPAKANPFLP